MQSLSKKSSVTSGWSSTCPTCHLVCKKRACGSDDWEGLAFALYFDISRVKHIKDNCRMHLGLRVAFRLFIGYARSCRALGAKLCYPNLAVKC